MVRVARALARVVPSKVFDVLSIFSNPNIYSLSTESLCHLMDIAFLTRLISLALIALPAACSSPSSQSFSVSAPPSLATITIASQIFVVNPANIILDGTTVQPGSAGISVDGQVVSADAPNDLFVDGSEVLAEATSSIFASNNAINNTVSLSSSSDVKFSGSTLASAINATASGFGVLGGEIAQLGVQVASNLAIQSAGDVGTTSVSASTSLATASFDGPTALQTAVISSASSAMISSSFSRTSAAGSVPNVHENTSQSQSGSIASVPMSGSTSKMSMIPSGSSASIPSNNSSGLYAVSLASNIPQSASSSLQSLNSAGKPSYSAMLVPAAQPATITTGPILTVPTISLNPTGSVASSQGMLLVGAIFGITEEVKTLSVIIKDDGPKVSFASKIEATDDGILNLLEDKHPPGPPPLYEEACLDGASIFDIFKVLGCLKGGFDEVIRDLEDEPPDLTKIQTIFDNIGKLAENFQKEENDDNETSTSETNSQSSMNQDSATKGSSNSMIITSSVTSTASSSVSSSTYTEKVTMEPVDTHVFIDFEMSEYNAPDVGDQAFMAYLADILSSAVGIGPGPSGFAVVVGSAKVTANLSSSTLKSSSPPKVPISSSALAASLAAAATDAQNRQGAPQTTAIDAASSQAVLAAAVATYNLALSSNTLVGFASLGGEIAQIAYQLAATSSGILAAGFTATSQVSTSTAAANAGALGSEIAYFANQIASSSEVALEAPNIASLSSVTSSISTSTAAANDSALGGVIAYFANQIASASAVSVDAANIASPSPVTSSSLAPSLAPSPLPIAPKWGIYLAIQTYTRGGADAMTDYYYRIWIKDLTINPGVPDFCAPESWIANVEINDDITNVPPYPTADFPFTIPANTVETAAMDCTWQPSVDNSGPGSMTCDPGVEIVLCSIPATTAITCKSVNSDRISPLVQCVW